MSGGEDAPVGALDAHPAGACAGTDRWIRAGETTHADGKPPSVPSMPSKQGPQQGPERAGTGLHVARTPVPGRARGS